MHRFVQILRSSARVSVTILTIGSVFVLIYLYRSGIEGTHSQQHVESPATQTLPNAPLAVPDDDETLYLPIINRYYNSQLSERIGYGATVFPITRYPEIRSLNAGWYVDWGVRTNPVRPAGMEYVQMIRVHQKIIENNECGIYRTADRKKCPYVEPYDYIFKPDAASIQAAAIANPGSTWLIGNEPDRMDWNGFGQDEMLPELYAVAYKQLYDIIKAVDPTAQVANAGVIQATPMRLEYMTKVWDEYRSLYGADMPVDVWNVHNFILTELCREEERDGEEEIFCYGAGSVPGSKAMQGSYLNMDWAHIDHSLFDQQIRAFRQWMKDRGQEGKPLIVTEYGVLYGSVPCKQPIEGGCNDANWVDLQNPDVVHEFMLWTFDYFLGTKDCALSTIDDCRLVQQWLWFSLDHEDGSSNQLGNLVDRTTKTLLPAGVKFKAYTETKHEELAIGY